MASLRDEIKKLREDFVKGTLNENEVSENPFRQFEMWLQQAVDAAVPEVQAAVLSTVSPEGKPASRIVYLREFENNQFWIYGNYTSRKAKHMDNNASVALNFFWPNLERQVRIEGTVVKCEASFSDNYFNNRPYESKLGAWASNQSSALKSRKELEDLVEQFRKKFENKEIPRPEFWGGWVLSSNYYEFWQGRKSRLHDRISYTLQNKNEWHIERLAP